MTFYRLMKSWQLTFALAVLTGVGLCSKASAEDATAGKQPVDVFDAIDQGIVDVKFMARNSQSGRLFLTNKTNQPVDVIIPDAFAGVPVMHQFGGGGGGMGGGGMGGGGGQQSVGGGGGGGGGRGGGGGGRGGGGGGRFSIPPEDMTPIDVPLVCLDHGLRDPSSNKPYEIRPIQDVVSDPAIIEVIEGYTRGDLDSAATQAAIWHLNSGVSWQELAEKLTGTVRNLVRDPYFSQEELKTAMQIVSHAQQKTAGEKVEPRNWKPISVRKLESEKEEKATETRKEYKPEEPSEL